MPVRAACPLALVLLVGCGSQDEEHVSCITKVVNHPGTWAAASVNTDRACAIDADGKPDCWARQDPVIDLVPTDLALTTIDIGYSHACGLDDEGTAWCWGTWDGPTDALLSFEGPFVFLDTAWSSCGLGEDGLAACWGQASFAFEPPTVPLLSIATSNTKGCAVRADDGGLMCWGEWSYEPAGVYSQVKTNLYGTDFCALDEDGMAQCFPDDGVLADESLQGGPYVEVEVSNGGVCGRTAAGHVRCAYAGGYEAELCDDVAIGLAGTDCAVLEDGTLRCWNGAGPGWD